MLKDFSPETFLADRWQKRPLFIPSAIDARLPVLDANEIAWLAMQPDIESRLVFTERENDKVRYRVEHGPFEEAELGALPAENWTLLVQDVEKHLPDFRAYFDLLPFIPSWRIDDLMVSLAAPGGSVGPHQDNYDVFLCQGEGSRLWRISNDKNARRDSSASELSLLQPFEPDEERACLPADLLYVPPGIPHWGIAEDLCTTYSIGMRAPTRSELSAGYARIYNKDCAAVDDLTFYSDSDLRVDEALRGQFSLKSVERIRNQQLLDPLLNDEQMMIVLGCTMTDPKAWLHPDAGTTEELECALNTRQALDVHGMAKLAFCRTDTFSHIFANGAHIRFPVGSIDLIRDICDDRVVSRDALLELKDQPEGPALVAWFVEMGVLDLSNPAG